LTVNLISRRMNSRNDPANRGQLAQLRGLGYEPNQTLSEARASELIGDPTAFHEGQPESAQAEIREVTKQAAYRLRADVESAQRELARGRTQNLENPRGELERALARRREFWVDTCREAGQMHSPSTHVVELYMKHGCRFAVPTDAHTQEILVALDGAMPGWDLNYPALFYQTLELNFPELLRAR
jgi:hypothetical protein